MAYFGNATDLLPFSGAGVCGLKCWLGISVAFEWSTRAAEPLQPHNIVREESNVLVSDNTAYASMRIDEAE